MPDYQPIDYRLRCHTKRTDLPSDVLRDIGEAYEYINDLQRRIQMLREGFEGSCTACEPVGEMNQKLREERDEARREVCGFHHLTGFLSGDYAASRGWDCFPNRHCKFEPSVKDFKLFLEGQDKIFLERIDRLTAERDEARQEICIQKCDSLGALIGGSPETPQDYAEERGWDCFNTPEPNIVKTLNGVIVDGGKATPPKYEDIDNA
jgi:hypothetical protein